MSLKILKFWWTSLGDNKVIEKVFDIITNSYENNQILVVVSAMSWVTNSLVEVVKNSQKWNIRKSKQIIKQIESKHRDCLNSLFGSHEAENIWKQSFQKEFSNLYSMIEGIYLLGELSDKNQAKILYFGEMLSSILVSKILEYRWYHSLVCYSKDFLVTNKKYLNWEVDYAATKRKTKNFFEKKDLAQTIPVITWFGWWDRNKNPVLLDRWWSDYVATILGNVLDADEAQIWTDVNGVYSSDPRIIKNPILRDKVDYQIAAELSLAGAKVLHPKTISPSKSKNIPILIKNTFCPQKKWSYIINDSSSGIKWINLNNNQILFHFKDNNMYQWIGYIHRVTDVFRNHKIPLDSFATSEVSFTCSTNKDYINNDLIKDLKKQSEFEIISEVAKISIVGNNILDLWKIYSSIIKILEKYNIYLLTQWSSFNNLTVFISQENSQEALKKLHQKIFNN